VTAKQKSKTSLQKPEPARQTAVSQVAQLGPELLPAELGQVGSLNELPDHGTARSLRQANILQMQRQHGNEHVQRMLVQRNGHKLVPVAVRPPIVQARLTLIEPDDPNEQEADESADFVIQSVMMPPPNEEQPQKGNGAVTVNRKPDDQPTTREARSVTNQTVMEREIAAAAAEPGVQVNQTDGGPVVLAPSQEPQTAQSYQPTSELPPTPPRPEPATDETRETTRTSLQERVNGSQAEITSAVDQLATAQATLSAINPRQDNENVSTLDTSVPPDPAMADTAAIVRTEVASNFTQEAIREQLPEVEPPLEDFMQIVESGRTVEEDKVEVQQLLAGLRSSAEQEKTAVLTEAEVQKAQIITLVETQKAAIQAEMQAQIATAQAHYATARTTLQTQVEQHKASVMAKVAEEIAQVQANAETNIANAEAQLTQRETGFAAFIQEQQQQPHLIAQQETARANAELEAAAQESLSVGEREAGQYSGQEDPAPKQRAAARRVARESAADIRAKKPAIASDLQTRANEFVTKYPEYGERIRQQIEEVQMNLIPAMREKAAQTVMELEGGREATLQAFDQRLQVDVQVLQTAETATTTRIQTAADQAIDQVQLAGARSIPGVDTAAQTIHAQIDQAVEGVAAVLLAEEEPFLPGVTEFVEGMRANIIETAVAGRSQLSQLTTAASDTMAQLMTAFSNTAGEIIMTAQQETAVHQEQAAAFMTQTAQSREQSAQATLQALQTQLQTMLTEALAQVDPAIEEARGEVLNLTAQFRNDIRPAVDQSIAEAKKPRTDPLETRVHEAAEQAGESWFSGLLRAIGHILIGLVILVLVALVVAAIAAAFGVILTAWTAIMIAGAILLLVGLGLSLYHRFTQPELTGEPWWKKAGLAVMDTIGLTGIIQSISGKDIVTGQTLNAGERTHQGVTGAFTLIMLFLGTRAAIKGPPGGAYVRPTGVPRGWVGWRNAPRAAGQGIRGLIRAIPGGRRVSGRFPDRAGPNEILYRVDPVTGEVTYYQIYDANGLPVQRVDLVGATHGGIPTPHVQMYTRGRINPSTGLPFVNKGPVRSATPNEIPGPNFSPGVPVMPANPDREKGEE
jgi:hypothetical protein